MHVAWSMPHPIGAALRLGLATTELVAGTPDTRAGAVETTDEGDGRDGTRCPATESPAACGHPATISGYPYGLAIMADAA